MYCLESYSFSVHSVYSSLFHCFTSLCLCHNSSAVQLSHCLACVHIDIYCLCLMTTTALITVEPRTCIFDSCWSCPWFYSFCLVWYVSYKLLLCCRCWSFYVSSASHKDLQWISEYVVCVLKILVTGLIIRIWIDTLKTSPSFDIDSYTHWVLFLANLHGSHRGFVVHLLNVFGMNFKVEHHCEKGPYCNCCFAIVTLISVDMLVCGFVCLSKRFLSRIRWYFNSSSPICCVSKRSSRSSPSWKLLMMIHPDNFM